MADRPGGPRGVDGVQAQRRFPQVNRDTPGDAGRDQQHLPLPVRAWQHALHRLRPGAIGRAVLATLLPARRLRFSARKVKCATSRYLNREDGRPAHPAAITAIDITISTPPVDLKPGRTRPSPSVRPAGAPAGGSRILLIRLYISLII